MNTKAQSLGNALLGIALVIVIFSAGFYFSGPKPAVSGNVVGITGMATQVIVKYEVNDFWDEVNDLWSNEGRSKLEGDYKWSNDGNKWEFRKEGTTEWTSIPSSMNPTDNSWKTVDGGLGKIIDSADHTGENDNLKFSYDGQNWEPYTTEYKVESSEANKLISAITKELTPEVAAPVQPQPAPEVAAPVPSAPTLPSPGTTTTTAAQYTTASGTTVSLPGGTTITSTSTTPPVPISGSTQVAPQTKYYFDGTHLYGTTVDSATGKTTYAQYATTAGNPQISGTSITFSSEVVGTINWNVYPTGNAFLSNDGKTTITKDAATDTYTYTSTENKQIVKTIIGTTTIESNYKKDGKDQLTTERESVTYTTPTGTLTVNEKVYSDMNNLGNQRTLFIQAAIDAGATSITSYDTTKQSITVGGTTIKNIGTDVYSYSGKGEDMNVIQYSTTQKIEYSGVKFDEAKGVDTAGSKAYTMTTIDQNGKVIGYETKTEVKNDEFETITIKYTDSTMSISKNSGVPTTFTKTSDGKYYTSGNIYFSIDNGNYYYDGKYEIYKKGDDYYYKDADGKEKSVTLPGGIDADTMTEAYNIKETKEGRDTISQKKWQQRFATFESILTEFSGLRGFSQLFWSDEDLDEWRESVDKVFASMYLGTDYWVSDICSKGVEREGEGTMYIETPGGLLEVGAHIEAEKTEPIDYQNGTSERLYKITYKVTNPEYEATTRERPEISFNVYLYGDITVQLYSEDIVVEEGGSFSRMGSSAIVQYSSHEYSKVCIVFSDSILAVGTEEVSEVCNEVTMYTGPATEYETTGVEVTSGGSGYGYGEEVDF